MDTIRNKKTQIAKHIVVLQMGVVSRNDVADQVALREYEQIVENGISQLSPAKQQIIRLRAHDGLDNGEISLQLGLSINIVKFQYSQASKFVREYLRHNAGIPVILAVLPFRS